jgi:hypothetical protein
VAFKHGKTAEVSVNSVALSAFCNASSLKISVGGADLTTFGATYKTAQAGLADGALDLTGNYDPTAGTGPQAVLEALIGAAPFPVIYYPGGNVSLQRKATFNAILTAYSESAPVGDKVTFSATLQQTGGIVFAQI